MDEFHTSVFAKEVVTYLQIVNGEWYIDATLGGGGHTVAILEKGGRVLGIEQDEEAIEYARKELKRRGYGNKNNIIIKGNFRDIDTITKTVGVTKVKGIVLDLGLSSYQLKKEERGFSFQKNGPLDMRMDTSLEVKAKDLLYVLGKHELARLFTTYGQERYATSIARCIVFARKQGKIETTDDLVRIIEKARGMRATSPKQRATMSSRVFQALRIAVNDELESLREALPKAHSLLSQRGKLIVISFHSLEDRIVKQNFSFFEKNGSGNVLTRKPIIPTTQEISLNPRSRSAKMRVFEKN